MLYLPKPLGDMDTHLDRIDGLYEAAALLAVQEQREVAGPLGQDRHPILATCGLLQPRSHPKRPPSTLKTALIYI